MFDISMLSLLLLLLLSLSLSSWGCGGLAGGGDTVLLLMHKTRKVKEENNNKQINTWAQNGVNAVRAHKHARTYTHVHKEPLEGENSSHFSLLFTLSAAVAAPLLKSIDSPR